MMTPNPYTGKVLVAGCVLLLITVSLQSAAAQWFNDDYPGDPNGYGHVSGEEDGDTRDQDDCELWFDITQNDYDWDGLTGSQEKAQGSKPFMPNSDMDGLDDREEYRLGTAAMHWGKDIDLYYRVVSVEPKFPVNVDDGFTTEVKKLIEDERDLTDNDDVSLSGIGSPRDLLYPAIGCPEFVDKSTSLKVMFNMSTSNAVIRVHLVSTQDSTYQVIWRTENNEIQLDNSGPDAFGRTIFNYSVTLPNDILTGLYNLTVYTSIDRFDAPHSVQVLDNFKTSFKFVQLTDVHIGNGWEWGKDNHNVGDFLALINRINKLEKPDFVTITGDLTDAGNTGETTYFKACLLKFNMPVFLTPGNHDHGDSAPNPGLDLGTIDNYNNYLVPRFNSGSEGDLDDYSFNYSDYHFIFFDSGGVTDIGLPLVDPPHLAGLTTDQLNWMKSDYNTAMAAGKTHTFIFTHGPIVGHGGAGTHNTYELTGDPDMPVQLKEDRDIPFVEWVNEQDMTVEAVFCGHMHMNVGYIDVDITNMNDMGPNFAENTILNIYSTVYLETTTACAGYTHGG
ncbi:MAG: metallophosphoesterase [Candidatus Thermoplasmatota archaeon]|nr:metallophosphoesterase [Candidatus Thermoplasmatota archaeon]MBU4070884.1 metallophosphoesterase [Candidatus Thermoplasmatota archaeon]